MSECEHAAYPNTDERCVVHDGDWPWGDPVCSVVRAAVPPEGLDDPLRIIGAFAHVAARPVLARLSITGDTCQHMIPADECRVVGCS